MMSFINPYLLMLKKGDIPTLKLTADILATGRLVPNMELEHQGVFLPEKNRNKKATNRRDVCYDAPKKKNGVPSQIPEFYGYKKNVHPDGIFSQKDGVLPN